MINRHGLGLPRRRVLLAVVLIGVAAFVGLLLLVGTSRSAPQTQPTRHAPSTAPSLASDPARRSVAPPATVTADPPLTGTDDPEQYAREVATALFDVAPSAVTREEFVQFWQNELPTVVYSDAAARGLTLQTQNANAIENLTRWWIPTQAAWSSEAADQTASQLTITAISVPDYWVNAVAAGTFQDPGLHMERVLGVLTQHYGTDPQHRYTSARSVVIDLGLLCGPTQPGGCRLVAPQRPPSVGSD